MGLEVLEVAAEGVPVRVKAALRLLPLLLDLLRDAFLRRTERLAQVVVLELSRARLLPSVARLLLR